MSRPERWYKVFVSSTFLDLREERKQISKALLEANCIPMGMEIFPASDDDQLDLIYRIIDECDFYLLVVGGRYGQMRDGMSFTELEFNYAVESERQIPILVFLQERGAIPDDKNESDPTKAKKLGDFRVRAKSAGRSRGRSCRWWSNGADLASGIISSVAITIRDNPESGFVRAQALSPASAYLRRYVKEVEPPLLRCDRGQPIDGRRAYSLLNHMFRGERFSRFHALDLAVARWSELVDDSIAIVNMSKEIFDNIANLLKSGRCHGFYRILVDFRDQLDSDLGQAIISRIYTAETEWEMELDDTTLETRLLIYPRDPTTREDYDLVAMIAQLHDFALFRSQSEDDLAIIETGLSTPGGVLDIGLSKFELSNNRTTLNELEQGFATLWEKSISIPEFLGENPRCRSYSSVCNSSSELMRCDRIEAFTPESVVELIRMDRQNCVEPPVIVVEGLYLDKRYPEAADRIDHLNHGLEIVKRLESERELSKDILISAFVSNFSAIRDSRICEDSQRDCDVEVSQARPRRGPNRKQLTRLVKSICDRRQNGTSTQLSRIFWMTDTKEALLDKLLRVETGQGLSRVIERQENGDLGWDLSVAVDGHDITIATDRKGKSNPTARCAGLLAQHYFDLLKWACSRVSEFTDLWIIDFSRFTEKERVNKASAATFTLFAWPRSVRVCILNIAMGGIRPFSLRVKERC